MSIRTFTNYPLRPRLIIRLNQYGHLPQWRVTMTSIRTFYQAKMTEICKM